MSDDLVVRCTARPENFGTIRFTVYRDAHTFEVTVEHADPRILVSKEFMDEVMAGRSAPCCWHSWSPTGESLITIDATDRKLIYRVVEYLPDQDSYLMEWPD